MIYLGNSDYRNVADFTWDNYAHSQKIYFTETFCSLIIRPMVALNYDTSMGIVMTHWSVSHMTYLTRLYVS